MIGYYVHHQGRGHLHRTTAISRHLRDEVTGLSSLPRPQDWLGEWVQLEPDDAATRVNDVNAGGRLHWAPAGDSGVRLRAAQLSAWFESARPSVFVSDVSVEAALLARLHGVPVVSVALPGLRVDAAHDLGYGISSAIVGAWPTEAVGMLAGDAAHRVQAVGAISRYDARDRPVRPGRRVVVLHGAGGTGTPFPIDAARRETPDWEWDLLGGSTWVDDPWPAIRDATVVVTHAGQNALAEIAAARRPAIVVPEERPFDEQLTTAGVLAAGRWPVVVRDAVPAAGWTALLERAALLDGSAWETWNDGGGAARAARIIESAAVVA